MVALQYILAIVGFSLIILVHEFGHFIFAKLSKMHVLEFFIGFGPKILKFKSRKTGTLYGLSAIPLGGYNKILGMERSENIAEEQKDKAFYNKPYYKKLLVIAGGGIFNIIFAIVLIIIFLSMGVYSATNVIDYIQPESPAQTYGFMQGDRIISINGISVKTWDDFSENVRAYPEEEVIFEIVRNNDTLKINAVLENVEGNGFLGVSPKLEKIKLGFFQTIGESFKMFWELTVTYIKLFGKLFSGQIPFEQARPASPIGVISIFQQSAEMGFQNFILFVAMVSILLAFGNFLPILPVDGGHIVIITLEAIMRRPVPRKAVAIYNTFGMVIVISLLAVGLIFDIISPINLQQM
ncbi:MAG: site-2 protease family protein [Actinobacteria bacterium]|nr:site-2 protease family protein [Actinomycetota bacterium]